MPTVNVYVGPTEGWVQVADSGAKFTRVSGYPHSHPYFLYAGSAPPSLDPSASTGIITFSTGVPVDGQTITVGSEVFTFRDTPTGPFEVTIGATNLLTAASFAVIVNNDSTLITAINTSGSVLITSKSLGPAGQYSLATDASNVSVSGAQMSAGVPAAMGVYMCHKPYWNNVTTTEDLYARVVNNVPNSANSDGKLRLDILTVV